MPFVTLQYTAPADAALAARLASELADLVCAVLRKDPLRTSVLLRPADPAHWFIAGRRLADTGRHAFRLEVTVTDETNTRAEKQRFQREAFALLSRLFGDIHPHSNVHVIDCRAAAYGYGGISQEEHWSRTPAQPAPDRT
ncbi:4-oxalocrotonate tautomerase [Thiomonas sp.]|jgi:4-oxalocrotonate tautomerase|uniref:tautomerase family protein n=1 Tax=Thiomonas sp. TaxID=2047785 RepID=UPI00263111A2|nr:4-oxalocrotonate tautomerase [Thiomonas sp.]